MKNREEIINQIEDAWVLQEILLLLLFIWLLIFAHFVEKNAQFVEIFDHFSIEKNDHFFTHSAIYYSPN